MAQDYRWQSCGGILLDGTGDIALSEPTGLESLQDMVRTRLKAAINGWKLYAIGADLATCIGQADTAELEAAISQQIQLSLCKQYLTAGTFSVEVISEPGVGTQGATVTAYVFLNQSLIATAQIQQTGPSITVNIIT